MYITSNGLTHWGGVTHICVGNLAIIGSDYGLSPGRHQAITWTNVGILLFGPLGTNFSEMFIEINTFSFKKIHLKMSPGNWRPFWLSLNGLICKIPVTNHTEYGPISVSYLIINMKLYNISRPLDWQSWLHNFNRILKTITVCYFGYDSMYKSDIVDRVIYCSR